MLGWNSKQKLEESILKSHLVLQTPEKITSGCSIICLFNKKAYMLTQTKKTEIAEIRIVPSYLAL
jgi:hypothetical protein